MKIKAPLFILFSIGLIGCSQNSQTNRAYQELGRSQHFHLVEDGYIIGLEKVDKKKKGKLLSGLDAKNGYTKRFKKLDGEDDYSNKLNSEFIEKTQGQQKVILATQITENFPNLKFMYNSYEESLDGKFDYKRSFSEFDEVFNDLSNRLASNNDYTHIIVMSMGWNNDQVESVLRYNKILKNLKAAAIKSNYKFKPLVIGFTWPSVWFSISDSLVAQTLGHLISYPTKANDADEIGYTWANLALNEKLPAAIRTAQSKGLKKENIPKVVVIGHSFGARVLSRALFSSGHLKSMQNETSVDLFFGLQGAFSVRRFIPGEGKEGSPYKNFNELSTEIILTSSIYDSANPVAAYVTGAHHVGGKQGLRTAQETGNSSVFDNKVWKKDTKSFPLPKGKVLMIDASEIVVENDLPNYKYSAHNDILDTEMGELLWSFIRQIP